MTELTICGDSISDIALFAYTHVAHEGFFNLDDHPRIRSWIERVENTEGFVEMAKRA